MNEPPSPAESHAFAPTRWTLVLRARGGTPEARKALGELCEAYWNPVFSFLRREGRDEDLARELTQEFFARLLAGAGLAGADPSRGRFRSFLLGALKHFLADARNRERRLKRGGGIAPESLQAPGSTDTAAGLQVPDPNTAPADEIFDRAWALAVMDRALTALARDLGTEGKAAYFETLKPWLAGDAPGVSQAEAGRQLGLSEGAVKVAIHRLRGRFRELVKSEIAQTLQDPAAVQEELRYLIAVLSHPRAG